MKYKYSKNTVCNHIQFSVFLLVDQAVNKDISSQEHPYLYFILLSMN